MEEARAFFLVESDEDNEEIFETLGEAIELFNSMKSKSKKVWIAIVRNAYREKIDGRTVWNYEDKADTFDRIVQVLPIK